MAINEPSFKDSQMHKYINTQIHKYTNTQIHKYTNTQIHKYTNENTHVWTFLFQITVKLLNVDISVN